MEPLNEVDAYALDVVNGRAPAGKYHRLSCERHLRDRRREHTPGFPYRFDIDRARRYFRFAEKLKHYKGEWAGQFIHLQPHQKFRKGCKYGWLHAATGLRRFRNSYEEIPRKNGKSLELSTETLYLTFFDGEPGADGYCAATKREQAMIIFNDCKKLVSSSGLKSRLKVQVGNIHDERTASKLEPLSADYNTMDGLNIHTFTLDEMHALPNRGTVDVLETPTGARRQPMGNKITTAGDDPVSPCGDEHEYACKVLEGAIEDETYFAFIAHADADDDWTLPETAAKANPNYGVSVNPEDLKAKVAKALNMPAAAATYKQKHLNLWVNSDQPWLSMDGWNAGQSDWSPESLRGESCYVGIDLASKLDLLSTTFFFPPTPIRDRWRLLQYIWTPEQTMLDRSRRDRAPYGRWVDEGWLRTMPGSDMDYAQVREVLKSERSRYDIVGIAFDPWHADKMGKELVTVDGFATDRIHSISQTFAGMSSAAQHFEARVLAGKVDARGCPVTRWSASNAVVQRDGKDKIQVLRLFRRRNPSQVKVH